MTTTLTAYHSTARAGRGGFGQLLHAEWTKFRTVRGWVVGTAAVALVMVLLSVWTGLGSHTGCELPGGQTCPSQARPVGPGGEPVDDGFYLVHQSLTGDGSITVRLTSLTGLYSPHGGIQVGQRGPLAGLQPGVQPWSKAGVIVKASDTQGSAYAAIMVTGGHGVRMQYNYTHDAAGSPGAVSAASPRWLRLTRSGDTLTGYESTDGNHWTQVSTAHLAGLPATVQAGMFAASPDYTVTDQHLGGSSTTGGPTQASGVFDNVSLQGQAPGTWTGDRVGGGGPGDALGVGFRRSGDAFTVTGSGDIAPAVGGPGAGQPIERTLVGAFAGLIVVIVLGAMFITAEYRRGLIRTTLTASPRRGRMLAAKAIVIGGAAFVTGLVAAAVAVPLGEHILRVNGNDIYPNGTLTALRVVVGTAALLAVAAVLALAVGTITRRSAGSITAVIAAMVLPYILATAAVLPVGPSQWLLRLTPAAAFAVQQSLIQYPQVSAAYTPATGYFPLAPWAGFAVLCGYAALAMGIAAALLRRRDA